MLSYILIRIITFPLRFLSYKAIHFLGNKLGSVAYYLIPDFRKRALCNLHLAGMDKKYAKLSFQNLMINCLEYAKLASEKDISNVAVCENPEVAMNYIKQGKGIIFFCGHQSNWEILFLEGTSRMPGVAIGRPIKNKHLYAWVTKMREKFGGKMVTKNNAAKEGLKALRKGCLLGIVGDQGMPDSGFSSLFLGKRAWTSPLPALLAKKTDSPIFVATTKRVNGKYYIRYSDPILPSENMMQEALRLFEKSIRESPGEWLWQHNRWKQQSRKKLKKAFRHETIAIVLDSPIDLSIFREIYPLEFITVFSPKKISAPDMDIVIYQDIKEIPPIPFKLVFNFTKKSPLKGVFTTLLLGNTDTLKEKILNY